MRKRILTLALATTLMFGGVVQPVNATQKKDYITGKEYVASLQKAIDQIYTGKKKKLSTKGVKLGKKVSYTDACVLANRADILINGKEVTPQDMLTEREGMNEGLKNVESNPDISFTIDGQTRIVISPTDIKKNIIKYKRIADLNKIPKVKRNAVIACYQKGIFVGDGVKRYNSSVKLGTNLYITKKQGKMITKRVLGEEFGGIRREVTPDGQLVRTTNLPKQAKLYPYVVEGLPNAFYDAKFSWGNPSKTLPAYYPRNVEQSYLDDNDNIAVQKNRFILADRVKKSLEVRMNVDYRIVNDDWVKKASRIYYGEKDGEKIEKSFLDFLNNTYLPNMKKNKVIIKSKKIVVDPWSLHRNKDKHLTFRCYAEFTTWAEKEAYKKGKQDDLLFLCSRKMYLPMLSNGKTVKLVFDISLGHLADADSNIAIENYYPTEDSLSTNWVVMK